MLYHATLGELAEKIQELESMRYAMKAVEVALRANPSADGLSTVLADYLADARDGR